MEDVMLAICTCPVHLALCMGPAGSLLHVTACACASHSVTDNMDLCLACPVSRQIDVQNVLQGYMVGTVLYFAIVYSLPISMGLAAVALDLPVSHCPSLLPFCKFCSVLRVAVDVVC